MADDNHGSTARRRGPRQRQMRFVVMNQTGAPDQDDVEDEAPQSRTPYTYAPPPLPSPTSNNSPSSETFTYPTAREHQTAALNPINTNALAGRSNPSLSDGSSSPAPESTPPPSTPGMSAPSVSTENSMHNADQPPAQWRSEQPQRPSNPDKSFFIANQGPSRKPSNISQPPVQSPTVQTPASTLSPVYSRQSPHSTRCLISVTADCEIFAILDASDIPSGDVLRERIYSKLRVPDEEHVHFCIYRTEIGTYGLGEPLTDAMMMDIINLEGDSKGSLKFLAQRYTGQSNLPPPPIQSITTSSIPPILTTGDFVGVSMSPASGLDSRSSASEFYGPERVSAGYEASVSDDYNDAQERYSARWTIKPPRHATNPTYNLSSSPSAPFIRAPSPPRSHRALSPARSAAGVEPYPATIQIDRAASGIPPAYTPGRPDYSSIPPPPTSRRPLIGNDAALERERALESSERQQQQQAEALRSQKRQEEKRDDKRRLDEAWVKVSYPPGKARPSTAAGVSRNVSRPVHATSSSHSGLYPPLDVSNRMPSALPGSRGQLPNPPTRLPTGPTSSSSSAKPVPSNWFNRHAPEPHIQSPQGTPDRAKMLKAYKSYDSLNSLRGSRKASGGLPASKSSANTSSGPQSASYMTSEYPISRREHNLSNSSASSRPYDSRNGHLSPTLSGGVRPPYSSSQTDISAMEPRRLPIQGSSPAPSAAQQQQWRSGGSYEYRPPPADHIGASPTPPRQPRQLPQSTATPVQEDTVFDEDASPTPSPHPYALQPGRLNVSASSKEPSQRPFGSSDSSSTVTGASGDSNRPDGTETVHRVFQEQDDSPSTSTLLGTSTRDFDSASSTVKPGDLGAMLDYNDSATLLAKQLDDDLLGNQGSNPYFEDDDDYSDDDSGSLWQPTRPPVKRRSVQVRPTLSIRTGSKPTGKENPYNTPPAAPPPFPPPPPPENNNNVVPSNFARPQVNKSKSGKSADLSRRESSIVKSSQATWAYRPNADDVYERLEEYFPDHDLDKPVIESGGASPTAAEPAAVPFPSSTANDKISRFRHKKSIRHVATEHKKQIDRTSRVDASTMSSSTLRKRNTKMWGSRVEEVSPYAVKVGVPPPVPESSPDAPTPKPIFKWIRGELIGRGTYGRVYLALNATTGEMIAVKQVEMPRTDSDRDDKKQIGVVEALKLESDTLKDLDHPNIVQYLGFEQTPEFLSIFLEYVSGGSVGSCLRKHGKFEDTLARSFTEQILGGLEYLHSKGIIHRDLKADNILVDQTGICKISDFGISRRTDDIEALGMFTSFQGSVFWMAPEVVQSSRKGGSHGYNAKVDIWSMGCVMLEMLTGRRPWENTPVWGVIQELASKQTAPPIPTDVVLSPEADDFRIKCFALKPEDRPSASELRKHPYVTVPPGWTFTGFH